MLPASFANLMGSWFSSMRYFSPLSHKHNIANGQKRYDGVDTNQTGDVTPAVTGTLVVLITCSFHNGEARFGVGTLQ